MKKIMVLMLAVIFSFNVIFPYSQANAESPDSKTCTNCALKDKYTKVEVEKKLEIAGVNVSDTSKKDNKIVQDVIKSNEELSKALEQQKQDGFKLYNDSKMSITYENIQLGGYHYDKAVVYAEFLQNTNGDAVVAVSWVDAKNKKFIKYEVGKVTKDELKKYNSIVSYEKTNPNTSTYGFTWNGETFACGLSGILACMTYCGVVGAACGPGIGACATICDLVCNTAFVIACM